MVKSAHHSAALGGMAEPKSRLHSGFEVWPLGQGLGQSGSGLHLDRKRLREAPRTVAAPQSLFPSCGHFPS